MNKISIIFSHNKTTVREELQGFLIFFHNSYEINGLKYKV